MMTIGKRKRSIGGGPWDFRASRRRAAKKGPQCRTIAALVGGGATAVWHWRRARAPRSAPAASNRDVNLDIGERVQVKSWQPDRTTRVSYRGSMWTARLAPGAGAVAGEFRVVAVENN